MKRVLLAVLFLVVVTVAVSLGTKANRDRAAFSFIEPGGFHTLDPAQMSYVQDGRLAKAVWEGLTDYHPKTTKPIEGVAYFPPEISEDRTRYVFTLRSEAKWSNGDPVTADDFIRGWRRAIEPGTADVYAELISRHIAGAQTYLDWRTAHVALLGLIRQLQTGSPIKLEALRQVVTGELGHVLLDRLDGGLNGSIPNPIPPNGDDFWPTVLDGLRQANVDWKKIGDEGLDNHMAQMEDRFATVGMKALGTHRLEVQLVRPTPYFLDLTSFQTYLPAHKSIEILRDRYAGRPVTDSGLCTYDPQWTKPDYHRDGYPGLITNGAYCIKKWDFKRRIRMEANPYYWDRESVRSKTMEIIVVEYQNAAFMQYEQDAVDMMTHLTMDYTPELMRAMREGTRDDIHAIPAFATYFYQFNCRPRLHDGRTNPLADARVRRALSRAVNRQDLVDHVQRLNNPIATTLIPPDQIPGYRSPAGLGYDPQVAQRELAEAGYPGGEGLPVIEILYNTELGHEPKVQAIKRMWEQELGINVVLVGKESKTFAEDMAKGRFMVGRSGWFGDYIDPSTFLDLCQSKNPQNYTGLADTKYDSLLARADEEIDSAKRLAILSEAERYLMEEVLAILPLYVYVQVYAWGPEVKGIYPNPRIEFPLKYIYVER